MVIQKTNKQEFVQLKILNANIEKINTTARLGITAKSAGLCSVSVNAESTLIK